MEHMHEEAEEYLNGWKRTQADFENYRKEEHTRLFKVAERAREDVLSDLLPVLDSLDRAQRLPGSERESEGLLLITKQIIAVFSKYGIREIAVEPGEEFNPEVHEAVARVPDTSHKEGSVVEVVEKGWERKGLVLRPAKVNVAE